MNQPNFELNRRELIGTALAASTVSLSLNTTDVSANQEYLSSYSIDTNISLFKWPFRNLPLDDTQRLVEHLSEIGIRHSLAGSFEGILHRDLSIVNLRLAEECAGNQHLTAIGTINPAAVGWEEDFRRCIEQHKMPGIRIYPNYHQYNLEHPQFLKLLESAYENKIFVQLAVTMEDTRTQHELVNVPDVDLTPLPKIMAHAKTPKVQLLNARLRSAQLVLLAPLENLYFDTSRIDGTDGLSSFLEQIPAHRVCYGSHAPLLIPEAAYIRIHESNLTLEHRMQLLRNNFMMMVGSVK